MLFHSIYHQLPLSPISLLDVFSSRVQFLPELQKFFKKMKNYKPAIKLTKIIFSSFTPCSKRTSIALQALPPVASIGSKRITLLILISFGNL
jgi:hypothetical protein